jgi:hypothetical protein
MSGIKLAPKTMHPLTHLACGDIPEGNIGQVLGYLATTLDRLIMRSVKLATTGDAIDISVFGPFLGRATVEVGLTAILARIDPYRVLAIRKSQLLESYDPKVRNPLSFNWTNDVRGDERIKDWNAKPDLRELQRALLCQHFNDLVWEEAFKNVLDFVPIHRGSDWMRRLKLVPPEYFAQSMRTKADRLYSELSKGIHHEFVVPPGITFDKITVLDLLGRSWEIIAALGLTACYSPAALPVKTQPPLDLFEEAQQELNN